MYKISIIYNELLGQYSQFLRIEVTFVARIYYKFLFVKQSRLLKL